MKFLLTILSLLLPTFSISTDYFVYIIDNNAKRTIIVEHNYNETSFLEHLNLKVALQII